MKKAHRFPISFFKNVEDDPIVSDSIFGEPAAAEGTQTEDERISALADVFGAPFGDEFEIETPGKTSGDGSTIASDLKKRDYVVNSIFAPPDLREDAKAVQQFFFLKEAEGKLAGLEEVNAMLRRGWRVSNAYASGDLVYKALVLVERG